MWKIWPQKDRLLGTSQKPQHRVKQEEKEVRENVMMTKMIESQQQNQRKMSLKMTIIVKTVRNRITREMSKR